MLRKRLLLSAVIIAPVLALFWLDVNANFGFHGAWLLPLAMVIGVMMAAELASLLKGQTPGVTGWVVYSGTALTILAVALPELFDLPADCPVGRWGWSSLAVGYTVWAAFLAELTGFDQQRQATTRIALSVFVVMYAGWLLSFLLAVRLLLGNQWGALAVFSVILIVKVADASAYLVGKRWGRRKLAPRLSPGKTVEGLLGGIVGGLLATWIVFRWLLPALLPEANQTAVSWWAIVGYGTSLTMAGVVGDLAESLVKRDMCAKDSSRWLPGLGGITDVADSLLLAAPASWLWWTTGWLGGPPH